MRTSVFIGVRMLDGKATDALEASGLSFNRNLIDVYVNCWGPKDDGKTFGKPGPLADKALREGAQLVSVKDFYGDLVNQGEIYTNVVVGVLFILEPRWINPSSRIIGSSFVTLSLTDVLPLTSKIVLS